MDKKHLGTTRVAQSVTEMIYYVSSGTLNPTLSQSVTGVHRAL